MGSTWKKDEPKKVYCEFADICKEVLTQVEGIKERPMIRRRSAQLALKHYPAKRKARKKLEEQING